ncbi:hypothetical protein Y032_0242g3437 [Ancylostoma ceylanicum]|uniref:Uncharacterized protein n=1 Tax=Ancylostoma ceylanicum TaxID=53326 RepID=A0A016SDN1_9BILA|nr:hypothetical protein Y032_0242g3437 [Ancylostoma ceylanicum]
MEMVDRLAEQHSDDLLKRKVIGIVTFFGSVLSRGVFPLKGSPQLSHFQKTCKLSCPPCIVDGWKAGVEVNRETIGSTKILGTLSLNLPFLPETLIHVQLTFSVTHLFNTYSIICFFSQDYNNQTQPVGLWLSEIDKRSITLHPDPDAFVSYQEQNRNYCNVSIVYVKAFCSLKVSH